MYVCKTYRQHNSTVITIPKNVCDKLDVHAGDYVSFLDCEYFPQGKVMCIEKLEMKHGRDK